MKKAIAIIQARMGSTRLPGKVLLPLADEPLLWHIYNRLSYCQQINKIIVATTIDKSDDKIENFCKKNKIDFYRGSSDNVLKRFIDIINKFSPEYVVRITGDTPFPTPGFIDAQIRALKQNNGDITMGKNRGWFFEGQGGCSVRVLKKAYRFSKDKLDLEHVGSFYLAKSLDKLRVVSINVPKELIVKNCRLTIDTPEDYQFISKIYKDLYQKDKLINLYMIKDWIAKNRKLLNIYQQEPMDAFYGQVEKIKKANLKKLNIVGSCTVKKEDIIKY